MIVLGNLLDELLHCICIMIILTDKLFPIEKKDIRLIELDCNLIISRAMKIEIYNIRD
jgi:hypothetical protein